MVVWPHAERCSASGPSLQSLASRVRSPLNVEQVRDDAFQLLILGAQILDLTRAGRRGAVLRPPPIECRFRNPECPTNVYGGCSCLYVVERRADLLFGELAGSHRWAPSRARRDRDPPAAIARGRRTPMS